jgi:hypothetical protein
MSRVFAGTLTALALSLGLLAAPASAVVINWDIDPALSNFRLAIPDQVVTLGTVTATMRLRNQNNATWTQNNAPVDGLLATNLGLAGLTPSNIQFLAGSSSLVGVNTGSYRPNPSAYNTAVTDTLNVAGTFTNTSSDPAVYAARVNASISIITVNTGFISFDNISYDLGSLITAITGTSFVSNALTLGILDSRVGFDGISTIVGQVVPDTLAQTGPISGTNSSAPAGAIVNLGGLNYRLTVPINMPVFVNLGGVMLNATATGTLVGFAEIPEPATLGLVAAGLLGLAMHGRRRRID